MTGLAFSSLFSFFLFPPFIFSSFRFSIKSSEFILIMEQTDNNDRAALVIPSVLDDLPADMVANHIELIAFSCVRDIMQGNMGGGFSLVRRTATNVVRDSDTGAIVLGGQTQLIRLNARNASVVARLLQVLATIHYLLINNRRVSQRELYYMLVHSFKSQAQLNDVVLDVSAMLAVPRYALNIDAATRGVLAGCIHIAIYGSPYQIDCEYVGVVRILLPLYSFHLKTKEKKTHHDLIYLKKFQF